ncbi:GL24731 [Drosophila persimilis]|uniref:adenylate cyclase n=1 Tax=Drosophila persimilis TaxID=7234 RepID=B4H8W8_DROPE|nr:GL24731 [Drosophila persimilis]
MPTSRRTSFKQCPLNYAKERRWEPDYLKVKCTELGLENEYMLYQRRQRISYLRVFYILHILATLFHCTMILVFCAHNGLIVFDIAVYVIATVLILSILSVNFNEEYVSSNPWILTITSVLSALILVFADVFQGTYQYYKNDWMLATSYDTYTILIIYMFLPIPSLLGAVLLGSAVSVLFITYFMKVVATRFHYFSMSEVDAYNQISVDVIHYFCFNLLGVFFRIINEIVVRSSFLNRHQYIMEKIWLRNARIQEKMLLDSIIPPQIAKPIQEDIKSRLARKGDAVRPTRVMEQIMAIQIHPEVTVLYADVVNYTHLTTTVNVEKLVRLLHDLYGRFDMAATQFEVQRIKFLGDCYYCVAGLMRPNPDHAKCCVNLGLSMISHIQEVRIQNEVDIDMRIGIHSGSVIAGVIGEAKLQFDIWGTDVTIANLLESTGAPGFVHISGRTLSQLDADQYTILPGTESALAEPFLREKNIRTYLLTGEVNMDPDTYRLDSWGSLSVSALDISERPEFHTHIGTDDSINDELREEFKNMPVSGVELFKSWSACFGRKTQPTADPSIHKICLHFNDPHLEWKYLMQSDYMFKYSILLAWCSGCSLIYIQLIESLDPCDICIVINFFAFFCLTTLLLIAWYKKICWWMYGRSDKILFNKSNCRIFRLHDKIVRHLTVRVCIYVLILASYFSLIVLIMFDFVFHHSATINPWFPSEIAHGMRILITLFMMYLKERHSEFNNKIGFEWSVDLTKKKQDADETNQSITIVLNNILPAHVVKVYIRNLAKHELYYEEYKMVSVMFASLTNFEMDLRHLRILNEIIREFDRLWSRAQRTRKSSTKENVESHEEVVFVMATFALDLMRTLWTVKKSYEDLRWHYDRSLIVGDMTIGISSGEVMAGVVGASHPHYDIWGSPVNMASRMYSTGRIGHIHVTEETALLLREFGVDCICRGMTFVKGAGRIPTYFVAIDDDYHFVPVTQWSQTSDRRRSVTGLGLLTDSSSSYEDD